MALVDEWVNASANIGGTSLGNYFEQIFIPFSALAFLIETSTVNQYLFGSY